MDRVVGLEGRPGGDRDGGDPDGHGRLELTKFHAPPGRGGDRHAPANTPGIGHVAFAVDDIDCVVASLRARGAELAGEVERYEDSYRLRYVRGPEGIIVELAGADRQVAAVVSWQAIAVALVGIAAGVPLGIAAGKVFWRVFATNFGVVPLTVVNALPVAALAFGVLAAANVLAFFPALLAARSRPAQLLRAE